MIAYADPESYATRLIDFLPLFHRLFLKNISVEVDSPDAAQLDLNFPLDGQKSTTVKPIL